MKTLALGALVILAVTARADSPEPIEFFEKKIRPLLVEHCYPCHSAAAKKQKGGLLLDSREGLRKGGDNGPVVVPGRPRESLLIKAVRHVGAELKMPPTGKLSEPLIAELEQWITLGAPDPRTSAAVKVAGIDFEAAKKHWAYQPIRKPNPPAVKKTGWAASPIDAFILAKLEDKGLTPSPAADRRTLLRRIYFDLIGLPPTFAEVEAFANDNAPDAFARVVDRLLSSPQYGERWGRHWLDVARFADTKDGVLMYGDDRVRPYAYTYRDYVVRAFNEDLPFDQFLHDQLAADLIEPKVEPWRLGAMGYLTLGRMFDNNIHDVLDDRIDVVTRGMLGLTVSCARCHDHKYDAIPTADYYSLYGVFASSEAPIELPLTDRPDNSKSFADFEKQAAPKRQEIQRFIDTQYALLSETARQRVGDYLVKIVAEPADPLETAIFFLSLAPEDLRPQILNRWRRFLDRRVKPDDPVFGPWHDLVQLASKDFAMQSRAAVERWQTRPAGTAPGQVNPLVYEALAKAPLNQKSDVASTYGDLLAKVYAESKQTPPPSYLLQDPGQQLLELVLGRDAPPYFPKSQTYYYLSRKEKDGFGGMKTALDRMAVKAPSAPPRAMILVDGEIHDPRVFVRGNPAQPGESVPRQFLRILQGPERKPFPHGSGRLDLAQAITAPDNPLTSRVMVNRVWMHHFGEPLVATPSDFGNRSTPPTHPELLDFLARTFHEDGWSLKKLHRRIVLSRTYQQASFDRPECRKVDPENQLLWRAHRRRLDLEAMRDAMLTVSGRLDKSIGGRPVDVIGDAANRRRTIYGLVDRQSLPGLYRAFDFASPDQSAERRPQTTVPQQALFGLNSPFMIEQAKALAARMEVAGATTPADRVTALYRLTLTRLPVPGEVQVGLRFLADVEAGGTERSQLNALQQLAQVLLLTNELMFVD